MSDVGKRLIQAAKEAAAMARGETPTTALSMEDRMTEWQLHRFGADPELDKIVMRRGGRDPEYDYPCNRPEIITCAQWECQKANQCCASPPNEGMKP